MNVNEAVSGLMEKACEGRPRQEMEGIRFFRKSLIEFIENQSVANANAVYSYFLGLYRLSDGCGEPLSDMMDVMHAYEKQAAAFTDKQRDHYIHSVNVFLLGVYAYMACPAVEKAFTERYGKGTFCTPVECFLFIWGNVSLFHDMGYPLEIASNQAKRFLRTISDVNGHGKKTSIGIYIDPSDDILSIETGKWNGHTESATELIASGINRFLGKHPDYIREFVSAYPKKMFNDRYIDHGFFSAVIILGTYADSMQDAGMDDSRFHDEILTIASAIAMHNMYPYNMALDDRFGPMSIEQHPAGYLLMLSDILQEWNRKSYGSSFNNAIFAQGSVLAIGEKSLRVNYTSNDGRLSDEFCRAKKDEICSCVDIASVFTDGFNISASCDNSATVLKKKIDSDDYEGVPRPMLRSLIEIAKAIHAEYNRHRLIEYPDRPLEYPDWDSLTEDLKYSNMCQALDYPNKMDAIGCHIEKLSDRCLESFTTEEIEMMSVMEHDRWMNERVTNGWVYGPQKNADLRISPYIVPWEELSEEIREYDRETVRNIIPVLKSIGMGVVRD